MPPAHPPDHPEELHITALGAQGDGIAETAAGPRYVAFALPGERVVAAPGGELPRLVSDPSPDRVPPVCRHFGVCGGCAAQHMSERLYAEWKREIVVAALRQRGLRPAVAPLERVGYGTRRRAVLTARRAGGDVTLGYHRRRSADLVDIGECPVLVGTLAAGLPALRALAAALPGPELRMTVLATASGLDIAVEKAGGRLGRQAVVALGQLAARHGLQRVAVDGETVIERARPAVPMGDVDVSVPPGAFVQATRQSEAIMRALLAAALASARPKHVADLFCGVGTFTFELARRARVLALDSDGAAIAALAAAARQAQGFKPIDARARDLVREPLSAKELEPFDAVVLDPPRAGAAKQAHELARSSVATILAVSCDAGTFARDAQILVDGGYTLAEVTPIDQFVRSAHVETVAVLRRAPGRRGTARRRLLR